MINDINNNNIPLKFKILQSDMDINTKSIALKQIEKISEMDSSSGEYAKIDQWISGLIKIPFNKYIYLPVNDDSSVIISIAGHPQANIDDIKMLALSGKYDVTVIYGVLGNKNCSEEIIRRLFDMTYDDELLVVTKENNIKKWGQDAWDEYKEGYITKLNKWCLSHKNCPEDIK